MNMDGQQPNDNEASKAVIASSANEGWGSTLDFADEGDLAERLNDNDVHALLLVIDAKNKMKRICLTGCNNIVGHGLEPLRESVVLEHICIPLPLGRMSTVVVTPILDSILETEGNALREIDVSNIVIDAQSDRPQFQLDLPLRIFLGKFTHFLYFENKKCYDCEEEYNRRVGTDEEQITVEPASYTCFRCFEGSCSYRDHHYHHYETWLGYCDHCGLTFCEKCRYDTACCECETFHCYGCVQDDPHLETLMCDSCNRAVCFKCIRDESNICACLHLPALVKQYEKVTEKNQELTEEIKQLHMENEDLQKNMSALGLLS